MDSFKFTQHVSGHTHCRSHTLDLVFTHGLSVDAVCSEDIFLSDHHCIFFTESESVLHTVACQEVTSHLNASTGANFGPDFNLGFSIDNDAMIEEFNDHCLFDFKW